MKVLVTGAGSFLGSYISMELSKRGIVPVAFVRKSTGGLPLNKINAEIIAGDITRMSDIERALMGCDAIIHAAALTDHSVASYRKFYEVNVHGSINIIDAAIKSGISRVVYISTANTSGYGTLENPGSENDPPLPPYTTSYYVRSKIEAEKEILRRAEGTGVKVVIINPTFMMGAFDSKPTSGEAVLRGLKRDVILATRGGKNFVNASDVAVAACNALTMGSHGHRYLVTGTNMDFRQFYNELARITGRKKRIIVLPSFLFLLAGILLQPLFIAGINIRINFTNMRMICTRNYYAPGLAIKGLNTPSTRVSVGIGESVRWFRENGYCLS